MHPDLLFVFNSALLGAGLAMDAFSVSLANALTEPGMSRPRMCAIAGVYGFFQALMPMTGWLCVHTILTLFSSLTRYVPWIAFILLAVLGGNMIREGLAIRRDGPEAAPSRLTPAVLLLQGVATSIDALSVGFTIAGYAWPMALAASLIVALVTFLLCLIALRLGRRFGTRLSWRANLLGGTILILIGLEILLKNLLA